MIFLIHYYMHVITLFWHDQDDVPVGVSAILQTLPPGHDFDDIADTPTGTSF